MATPEIRNQPGNGPHDSGWKTRTQGRRYATGIATGAGVILLLAGCAMPAAQPESEQALKAQGLYLYGKVWEQCH